MKSSADISPFISLPASGFKSYCVVTFLAHIYFRVETLDRGSFKRQQLSVITFPNVKHLTTPISVLSSVIDNHHLESKFVDLRGYRVNVVALRGWSEEVREMLEGKSVDILSSTRD